MTALAESWDAIVVGAGPAGASAAYGLARAGRRVLLLDRRRFPRDKSCGDGLTRPAVARLDAMGVLDELAGAQRVDGVRVHVDGRGTRDFAYPGTTYGLVVPRHRLDAVLCRRAVDAGARLVEEAAVADLVVERGAVAGVRVTHAGRTVAVRAAATVIANGSGSRLAERARLVPSSPVGLGVAIRAYYDDVEGLGPRLEIHAPLVHPGAREVLPSYGWVFPTGPRSANVGVGLFERSRRANVRDLLRRLLAGLATSDRLSRARPRGAWRGAPLRFDFVPERCAGPGFVAVGDAAGMVSPFTGEGISYALESGALAAEVIDRNHREGAATCPGLDDYALLLGDRYTGYFETGRESARRHRLVWRVLDATFESERPLFHVVRRAALFPEGVGELYASRIVDDVGPFLPGGELRVRDDLLAVGEVLVDAVRRDWPFLARAAAMGRGDPGVPFRPALLLLLAASFGDARAPGLVEAGAAIELGYLAALAQLSVEDAGPRDEPNWGNAFAVIVGDFLLARANELTAALAPTATELVAAAMQRAAEGRTAELRRAFAVDLPEQEHVAIVERKTATLFELPCRLGAVLAGAAARDVGALGTYGRRLGVAYQLADDALAVRGRTGSLGRASGADPAAGVYGLALLRAAGRSPQLRALLATGPLSSAGVAEALRLTAADASAVDGAIAVAAEHAHRAREAIRGLPHGPGRTALAGLTHYAATRRLPAPPGGG